MRVLILGGGIAGLAAAHEIAREAERRVRAVRITVLEKAPRPGGNIQTVREEGFVVEAGPNGFLDNESATLDLAREFFDIASGPRAGLKGQSIPRRDISQNPATRAASPSQTGAAVRRETEKNERPDELLPANEAAARRFLFHRGALHELPLSPPKFLRSPILSRRGRLRVLCEPFVRGAPEADESVFDFAKRRIGCEAAKILVDAMVTGVFAGDPHALSLKSTFPRMHQMEREHGSLFKAMLAKRRAVKRLEVHGARLAAGSPPSNGAGAQPRSTDHEAGSSGGGPAGPGGRLWSFKKGMATLIEALAAGVEDLRCGVEVRAVAQEGATWRVSLASGASIEADHLIFATPWPETARLLSGVWQKQHPLADATASNSLQSPAPGLIYAPVAVVALAFDKARFTHPLDGFGFLAPFDAECDLLGCLWTSSLYDHRAPSDRVLLRSMIGGARKPDLAYLPDHALVELTLRELHRTIGVDTQPTNTWIFRHLPGIPQYTVGHAERLDAFEQRLTAHPGLWALGNSYRGVAINHQCAAARRLASALWSEA